MRRTRTLALMMAHPERERSLGIFGVVMQASDGQTLCLAKWKMLIRKTRGKTMPYGTKKDKKGKKKGGKK
jgi:hypothetical protein